MRTGKTTMDAVRKAQAAILAEHFAAPAPAPVTPAPAPTPAPVVNPELARLEEEYRVACQASKDAYAASTAVSVDGGASYELYSEAHDREYEAKRALEDGVYEHEQATEKLRKDAAEAREEARIEAAEAETRATDKAWANEEARQARPRKTARRNLEQEVAARHAAEQRAYEAVRFADKVVKARLDQMALANAYAERALDQWFEDIGVVS